MLKETTLYTAICDRCEKDLFENANFSYGDTLLLEQSLKESDWHDTGQLHFCPDCYTIDENNELKLKPSINNDYQELY